MTAATHPLRCRCGALQGQITLGEPTSRMVCHCKDCQALARYLGPAERVLNAQGGSDLVQLAPHRIRFTPGHRTPGCYAAVAQGHAALVRRVLSHPGGRPTMLSADERARLDAVSATV